MMQGSDYTPSDSVVCIGGTTQAKAAALYFDHLLPLMYGECPDDVLIPGYHENSELQSAVTLVNLVAMQHLPGAPRLGAIPINQASISVQKEGKSVEFRPKHIELSEEQQREADLLIANTYVDEQSEFRKAFSHFLGHHLKGMPLVTPLGPVTTTAATVDDVSVILSGLPIVDAGAAAWDHILEFRKDVAATAKLRRLRHFAYDKLRGKSRGYIEDTLRTMLDDHESAAKDHGFEVRVGALTTLIGSKTTLATGVAALAAALAGTPITAGIAAIAGLSLEIATISLAIAQKKHAFHKVERDHPLAYIIEARKRLE